MKDYSLDVPLAMLTEIAERDGIAREDVAREHGHACRLLWANVRGQWLGEPALERVAATLGVQGEDYLPADARMRQAPEIAPAAEE